MKAIYCIVDKDKYRMIKFMADTPEELAAMAGLNPASVRRAFARRRYVSRKNSKYEIIFEEDE